MRTIYVLRHSRTSTREASTIAFSHRRAAERYRENIVKRKWKESIDFDRLGSSRRERLRYYTQNGYDIGSYEFTREKSYLDREMEQARLLKDAGYARFLAQYEYNYGPLPVVEEVKLYRTYADFNAPRE